ncbi:MAG: substrate-binding domain-containing protein [Betaproteobacteria bacterium]
MELPILSAGAARGLVAALAGAFFADTGAEVKGAFGAVGAMKERIKSGEPCDVVILTEAMIAGLEKDGEIVPGTAAPLGRVRTGIAVRAGEPQPSIGDAGALSRALVAAPAIYLPDPQRATAGIHFADVLKRLGILADVEPRLKPFPNGATAMRELAAAGPRGAIGCTQITEIRYTAGVVLVGPLPDVFELVTVYTAAVSTGAAHPDEAREFVRRLASPESRALRAQGGFED